MSSEATRVCETCKGTRFNPAFNGDGPMECPDCPFEPAVCRHPSRDSVGVCHTCGTGRAPLEVAEGPAAAERGPGWCPLADFDQTPDEARAELEEDGVDVEAFQRKVAARLEADKVHQQDSEGSGALAEVDGRKAGPETVAEGPKGAGLPSAREVAEATLKHWARPKDLDDKVTAAIEARDEAVRLEMRERCARVADERCHAKVCHQDAAARIRALPTNGGTE